MPMMGWVVVHPEADIPNQIAPDLCTSIVFSHWVTREDNTVYSQHPHSISVGIRVEPMDAVGSPLTCTTNVNDRQLGVWSVLRKKSATTKNRGT